MPDNDKMMAIFYGSSLLAFESADELALKSAPAELLRSLSVINHHIFQLKDGGKRYKLRLFYEMECMRP